MKNTLPFLLLITPIAFAQSPNGDPELFENSHVADIAAAEKKPTLTITDSTTATATTTNKPIVKLTPESPSIESSEIGATIAEKSVTPTATKTITSTQKQLAPPPQAQLKSPDLSQPYKPFLAKPSSNQYRDIYFGYTELNLPLSPNEPLLTKKIDGGTFGFQYTHLSYPAQEGNVNIGLRIGADVSYGKEKSQVDLLGQDVQLNRHHLLAGITLAPVVAFHLTDNFMVFGQGGAAFSYINVKATATEWLLPYPKEDESISDMALGYTYGGGLNYTFADQSTLGLEYQYKDIEHKRKNEETFDLNTHTVKLTFGKRF